MMGALHPVFRHLKNTFTESKHFTLWKYDHGYNLCLYLIINYFTKNTLGRALELVYGSVCRTVDHGMQS